MTKIQEFDFSVNLLRACLWQYQDAKNLQNILNKKQLWYDENHVDYWKSWVNDVFNLDTANDFGLSVWAIILDVPLNYSVSGSGNRYVFGFGGNNGNYSEFDNTPANKGVNFGRDANGVVGLTTEQKRIILKLRYYQLIARGTVPEMNFFLKSIFGSGVHVLDGLDMTCTIVFSYQPSRDILFILENFDILPRPAGVKMKILINPINVFGFDPYYVNFNNGNFYSYENGL